FTSSQLVGAPVLVLSVICVTLTWAVGYARRSHEASRSKSFCAGACTVTRSGGIRYGTPTSMTLTGGTRWKLTNAGVPATPPSFWQLRQVKIEGSSSIRRPPTGICRWSLPALSHWDG